MINKTGLHRILYMSTGLVIMVTLILAFIVFPSVRIDTSPQAAPESAVPGIWFVIIIHLLIIAALVWTIRENQRGGRIKGSLIALGVVLLLLSIMVLDGASAYLDHTDPIMHRVAISMFICTACNFIASVLALLTAWYSKRLKQPLK